MRMHIQPISTVHFQHDGRGPTLIRWLHDSDLYLPDTWDDPTSLPGTIVGAEYVLPPPREGSAWVIFYGLQVLQIVPEEVHSYWHSTARNRQAREAGVWRIGNSPWLTAFNPRHLAEHQHFVLEWYDDIVEVICRELVFGDGRFDLLSQLVQDGRFAIAYLRRAEAAERRGEVAEAIDNLERYIMMALDQSSVAYAKRLLEHIQLRSHTP